MEIKFDVKIHLSEEKIQTSRKKFVCVLNNFYPHGEILDIKRMGKSRQNLRERCEISPARKGKVFSCFRRNIFLFE